MMENDNRLINHSDDIEYDVGDKVAISDIIENNLGIAPYVSTPMLNRVGEVATIVSVKKHSSLGIKLYGIDLDDCKWTWAGWMFNPMSFSDDPVDFSFTELDSFLSSFEIK